jgi:hypothetical protein
VKREQVEKCYDVICMKFKPCNITIYFSQKHSTVIEGYSHECGCHISTLGLWLFPGLKTNIIGEKGIFTIPIMFYFLEIKSGAKINKGSSIC